MKVKHIFDVVFIKFTSRNYERSVLLASSLAHNSTFDQPQHSTRRCGHTWPARPVTKSTHRRHQRRWANRPTTRQIVVHAPALDLGDDTAASVKSCGHYLGTSWWRREEIRASALFGWTERTDRQTDAATTRDQKKRLRQLRGALKRVATRPPTAVPRAVKLRRPLICPRCHWSPSKKAAQVIEDPQKRQCVVY